MNYIQITIPASSEVQKEIAIALLENIGYESFEEKEDSLEAFIPEDNYDKLKLESCLAGLSLPYSIQVIGQQNWNAEWEKNFEPVTVGNFAGVRASFHLPLKNVEHEIVITPKMSFGTGHHATTWLMMQAMEKIDFAGKNVFDFGTGTGILAILAEKLGAANIVATDNDDWCIENAVENASINQCSNITIVRSETVPGEKFDIILANINYNIIVQNLPLLKNACREGARVLFSGLLTGDEVSIRKAIFQNGFIVLETAERNGWICIHCQNS